MITDREWDYIAKKVFSRKQAKAPAFLWTRVLSAIEAQENASGGLWWAQWRWMTQVTAAVGLAVLMGAAYLYTASAPPLEALLQGRSTQQKAIQLATRPWNNSNDAIVLVMGGEQWADN